MPATRHRSEIRAGRRGCVVGVVLSFVGLGCGAGPVVDSREAALGLLPGPVTAWAVPVPSARAARIPSVTLRGAVRHEFLDAEGVRGVGPLDGLSMRVRDRTGTEVASSYVGITGGYELSLSWKALTNQPLIIELSAASPEAYVVCGQEDQVCTYQHATAISPGAVGTQHLDITVPLDQSEPFHILGAIRKGYRWYRDNRNDAYRLGQTRVVFADSIFPAMSYYNTSKDEIVVIGSVDWTGFYDRRGDAYDDSVILHQFGYRLLQRLTNYRADFRYPLSRWERDHPPLAWREGLAVYLAQAVLGSNRYQDGAGSYDIDEIAGMPTGTDDGTEAGDLAAGLVTAVLWDLTDSVSAEEHDFLWELGPMVASAVFEMASASLPEQHGTPYRPDLADFIAFLAPQLPAHTRARLATLLTQRFDLDWL